MLKVIVKTNLPNNSSCLDTIMELVELNSFLFTMFYVVDQGLQLGLFCG